MKDITALIILDGFGCSDSVEGNAIKVAGVEHICALMKEYPTTRIAASGLAVGLPEGQMGNSEVGHLNIGAGRIVYQELTRITKSIDDGDFFENPAFLGAIKNCAANSSALHLMGLISDGGVHSHLSHVLALVELAKRHKLERVYVHCFMDGRDVPPQSGAKYIDELEQGLKRIGCGRIATVSGRYYAMDRDNRFERVEKAYSALVYGEGVLETSAADVMAHSYEAGVTDEFVLPAVIVENGKPVATVKQDDSIIFFNFRPDRARELTASFIKPEFEGFPRRNGFFKLYYVTMTQYDKNFDVDVAYKPESLKNTLGEYLSANKLKQLRIAETEKYAHVTFFFNGGVEVPNEGEIRKLIPSPKVATYDLLPQMSAYEVADEAVKCIKSGEFDCMILNFANPDMVGHTGVMEAAVAACKAVDECVQKVVDAILAVGGRAIITADHGNAELMYDKAANAPFTAHTTNPVPVIIVDPKLKGVKLRDDGNLSFIAPTLLTLMGLPIPEQMTGESMVIG